MKSVDQVAPAVKEIQSALQTYPNLPPNFTGTICINKWAQLLASKKASDELEDEEVRQLKYELANNVLEEFNKVLRGQ